MNTQTERRGKRGKATPTEAEYTLTEAELARLDAAGNGFNLQNLFANAQAYLDRGGQIFYPGMNDHISHPQSENRGG